MFGIESQPSLSKNSHSHISKRGAAASTSPYRHGEGDLLDQITKNNNVKRPAKHVPAIDLSNPNLIFE